MKLDKRNQVFNLYDTNGRRKDIINAYQIYLDELNKLNINEENPWAAWPNSLSEFNFYKNVVKRSPNTFKKHPKFDDIEEKIKNDNEFANGFLNLNEDIKKDYPETFNNLDKDVEQRARHYISNLQTMGFITPKRNITEVGSNLLKPSALLRDVLENQIPVDNLNLLIFRQAMKIRIYNKSGNRYYSPIKLAMLILLIVDEQVSTDDLLFIVQSVNPFMNLECKDIIKAVKTGGIEKLKDLIISEVEKVNNPNDDNLQFNLDDNFYELIGNRKSRKVVDIYYKFYNELKNFRMNKTDDNLEKFRIFLTNPNVKNKIKKAFGNNRAVFQGISGSKKISLKDFKDKNKDNKLLNADNFDETFYNTFIMSKHNDRIRENALNTRKIMEATGMFSTKSGICSLVNGEFFNNDTIKENLESDVFGNENINNYERDIRNHFFQTEKISDILGIDSNIINKQLQQVKLKLNIRNGQQLEDVLNKKRDDEFKKFIHDQFPEDQIFRILSLFQDRANDNLILKSVTDETDIPTIFEYVVGIAWYYLSDDKDYDLKKSFNLTLNSNFLPVGHAPGGDGDIVINYKDLTLMLEVTLMNKNAQKRGEWEPVLRHSVNLSIDSPKPVLTMFVADVLDSNTINIWRAVSNVPLESSKVAGKYTNTSVKIMPIKINDMISFRKSSYFDSITFIDNINKSFKHDQNKQFNVNWYSDIINESC